MCTVQPSPHTHALTSHTMLSRCLFSLNTATLSHNTHVPLTHPTHSCPPHTHVPLTHPTHSSPLHTSHTLMSPSHIPHTHLPLTHPTHSSLLHTSHTLIPHTHLTSYMYTHLTHTHTRHFTHLTHTYHSLLACADVGSSQPPHVHRMEFADGQLLPLGILRLGLLHYLK